MDLIEQEIHRERVGTNLPRQHANLSVSRDSGVSQILGIQRLGADVERADSCCTDTDRGKINELRHQKRNRKKKKAWELVGELAGKILLLECGKFFDVWMCLRLS